MSKKTKKSIYLDNNGTTIICPAAEKAFIKWIKCYNASTNSKVSKGAKDKIMDGTDYILDLYGVSRATHTLLFTSGATESNCFIIRACCKAFKKKLIDKGVELIPHIIISAIEHNSIIDCVRDLESVGDIEVTYVRPTIYGNILAADVERSIKKNTCLIAVMFANNEIPIINNISDISAVAQKHGIPIHCDAVQVFGKINFNIKKNNINSVAASAHKFYGPKGVGISILDNDLIDGYKITAEINGSQQGGLRGGTENVPGIISTVAALQNAFIDRKNKNLYLLKLRTLTLEKLAAVYKFGNFESYVIKKSKPKEEKVIIEAADRRVDKTANDVDRNNLELLSLGPPDDKKAFILPNTILLSVCKNKGKPFCNAELKKFLDAKNIIVSVGSACMTDSKWASHVLDAIGAPPVVKRGVIRISFGDNNTEKEVVALVEGLRAGINKQCGDL